MLKKLKYLTNEKSSSKANLEMLLLPSWVSFDYSKNAIATEFRYSLTVCKLSKALMRRICKNNELPSDTGKVTVSKQKSPLSSQ